MLSVLRRCANTTISQIAQLLITFQESTYVLEESFHSFPSIYSSVIMHATIIAHSAKSPALHNVIALYPMARVVWSNRHPEPD
jgi:hypothetical protein